MTRSLNLDGDVGGLYLQMCRVRHFEQAIGGLWRRGLIPGEMHLGTGEEAIIAGTVAHLREGDALALDHRSTPALVARGVDLVEMILEMLGSEKGLCRAMGGHMHLFSKEYLAASSGIVGSSAPIGAGFALAGRRLRPGSVAVSFLGEGAMNQGMALETLNLAAAWKLPLVIVCKDSGWAITTRSRSVTGGHGLAARAAAFGFRVWRTGGGRVDRVYGSAGRAIAHARSGRGPAFVLARCTHMEGHFLGDPILRVYEDPVRQVKEIAGPISSACVGSPGAPALSRMRALGSIGKAIGGLGVETYLRRRDPMQVSGKLLSDGDRSAIDREAAREVEEAIEKALREAGV